MEARVELALRHATTLHSAEARPVGDSKIRDPSQQDLDDAAAQVVRDEQIRVDQVQLADETVKHLTFGLEDLDIGVSLLLNFLLEVER